MTSLIFIILTFIIVICITLHHRFSSIAKVNLLIIPLVIISIIFLFVANIENGGFSIEHRFLDYDRKLAADILMQRTFEGKEQVAQMLLHPDKRHV